MPTSTTNRRTDRDVKRFYSEKGGSKMLTEPCYSWYVGRYFKAEQEALERLFRAVKRYTTLLEVGCGQGRYMAWATNHQLKYQGLDLVPWLVHRGRKSLVAHIYGEQCRLDAVSVNDMHHIINDGHLDPRACLAFFPFNCFGNLAEPEKSVEALSRFGIDTFVSGFRPTPFSTLRRTQYYAQCGYTKLTDEESRDGVLVRSAEGLNSWAYRSMRMDAFFRRRGYRRPRRLELHELGLGHYYEKKVR